MSPEALGYFVCPVCKSDLCLKNENLHDRKIKDGQLECTECKASFEIKNFIPRFVESQKYVGSFGDEWRMFKDVKNSRPDMSRLELKDYLVLEKQDAKDKLVMEIGCGAGPYLDIMAREWNAKHIFGVDLSLAVDAAYENVGHLPNVTIIQADLFSLPFKDAKFDLVYSLGVLHHTPDTKSAFDSICKYVKNGGWLSVWLYGAYWLRKSSNQDRLRRMTKKLSSKQLFFLSQMASWLYYLYKLPFIGNAFRDSFPIAMDADRCVRALNTFDMYSPTFINRHYADELYGWFKESGFTKIEPSRHLLGMKGCKDA